MSESSQPFDLHVNLISGRLDELRALVVSHLEDRRAVDLHDVVAIPEAGIVRNRVECHLLIFFKFNIIIEVFIT